MDVLTLLLDDPSSTVSAQARARVAERAQGDLKTLNALNLPD
jgi:hypothetical protein